MRAPLRSAMAPRIGASTATTRLAAALATPNWNVLTVTSLPALQYFLKNNGKNPANTVVAKAEFAQS